MPALGLYDLRSGSCGVLYSEWQDQTALTITIYHAMERPPDAVGIQYLCTAADNGYVPGEMAMVLGVVVGGSVGPTWAYSLQEGCVTGYTVATKRLNLKSNPASGFVLNTASWKLRLLCKWDPQIPANI